MPATAPRVAEAVDLDELQTNMRPKLGNIMIVAIAKKYPHRTRRDWGIAGTLIAIQGAAIRGQWTQLAARRMRSAASAKTWAPSTMSSSLVSSDQ